MTITDDRHALRQAGGMVVVPGARYTSQEFFDLEMERLWPRVWQVACREEEIPNSGDFLEYTIGDQSILVVRSDDEDIKAFFNACPHRGTRLASGVGSFATSQIRCPYHGWRWNFEGEIAEVVDRHEFPDTMTDDLVCLGEVQVGRWGGFVFVNMDPNCEPFDSFLGNIPDRFATYRFHNLRFRSYRTIVFECNWKTAVDAFNESYHPQALHPQMLSWFNDTLFTYEQLGQHSRYYVPEDRQREAGPSPRLGLSKEDVDPAEVLAERVDAVAGLFPREDQAVLEDLKKNGPPPGKTIGKVFDELRLNAMRRSGIDVEGLTRQGPPRVRDHPPLPELPRAHHPRQRHALPRQAQRPRPRQHAARLLGPRVGAAGFRTKTRRAQVLRGLVHEGLGPHQQPGLRELGRGRQGHEVQAAIGGRCSIRCRKPTCSTITAYSTSTSRHEECGQRHRSDEPQHGRCGRR